nr:methyl-accepting chemotaxis protein [Natroniella sulfidigena]
MLYIGLLVTIICLGLGRIAYVNSSNTLIGEMEERLAEKAEDVASLIKAKIDIRLTELETIANREVIRTMDQEEIEPILEEEIERTEYATMAIVEPDGIAHYVDGTTLDLSDRDYIQQALAGNTTTSDMLISRAVDKPVVMAATPIIDGGEVIGVLIARILGSDLIDIITDITFGETGYAYMFNNQGDTIAHQTEEFVMEQFNPIEAAQEDDSLQSLANITEEMIEIEAGFGEYYFDGDQLYMGYSDVPETEWVVGVTLPQTEVLAELDSLRLSSIIVSIIFLIISLLIVYIVSHRFTEPITKVVGAMNKLEGKDLTAELSLDRKDEFGDLERAFNQIQKSIKNLVVNITDNVQVLSEHSQELSASAEETTATLETTNQLIDNISIGIQEISASAKEVANFSEGANSQVNMGTQNIKATINSIKGINQAVTETVGVINELDNNSAEIGKIIELITNIAEQTNLLALNASIEAARAGEHGRGFTIVADEIRELAEQTSNATDEIEQLVNNIQQHSKKGLEKIKQVEHKATEGKKVIERTGGIFEEIKGVVEETSIQTEQTANSTNELAQDSNQVNDATEEINVMSEEVTNSSLQLAEMAEKLQELIEKFEVSN